jgi:hypothetical protein
MSMEKVRVLVPALRAEPRGAVWVGAALDWALAALARQRSAWQWRRSQARERRVAELASRSAAADRAAVVALAHRFESSQPEFAKDLHAAAGVDRDR